MKFFRFPTVTVALGAVGASLRAMRELGQVLPRPVAERLLLRRRVDSCDADTVLLLLVGSELDGVPPAVYAARPNLLANSGVTESRTVSAMDSKSS